MRDAAPMSDRAYAALKGERVFPLTGATTNAMRAALASLGQANNEDAYDAAVQVVAWAREIVREADEILAAERGRRDFPRLAAIVKQDGTIPVGGAE